MIFAGKKKARRALEAVPTIGEATVGARAIRPGMSVRSWSRCGAAVIALSALGLATGGSGALAATIAPMVADAETTDVAELRTAGGEVLTFVSRSDAVGLNLARPNLEPQAQPILAARAAVLASQAADIQAARELAEAAAREEAAAVSSQAAGTTAATDSGTRFLRPSNGRFTSGFGYRSSGFHKGVDLAGPCGNPIWAAQDGTVIRVGWQDLSGLSVDIRHDNGVVTRYYHASRTSVTVGQRVTRGQKIASVGSTGHSTGCHLHFQVEVNGNPVNPARYINL